MSMPEAWDGGWGPFIQCPHCHYIDRETSDYPDALRHDGDEVETDCARCGKPMRVTLALEPHVRTEPVAPRSPSSGTEGGGT